MMKLPLNSLKNLRITELTSESIMLDRGNRSHPNKTIEVPWDCFFLVPNYKVRICIPTNICQSNVTVVRLSDSVLHCLFSNISVGVPKCDLQCCHWISWITGFHASDNRSVRSDRRFHWIKRKHYWQPRGLATFMNSLPGGSVHSSGLTALGSLVIAIAQNF